MDPIFSNKMHYNWNKTTPLIITWRWLNNSVHFNLLRFELGLLSRERETEHDAANFGRHEPLAYLVNKHSACQSVN